MGDYNPMENEEEVLGTVKEDMRSISDKTQATIYVIAAAIATVIGPILISGLFGWAISLTGLIFVFLGICGFIYVSDDAKKTAKKA